MMSHCQSCRLTWNELSGLQCGHYLCETCVNRNTGKQSEQIVRCPFKGRRDCGEETSYKHLERLTFYISQMTDDPRRKREPPEKVMEPELIALAEELGIDPHAKKYTPPVEEEISPVCTPPPSDPQPDTMDTENDELYQMMKKLSETSDECVEIRGFYESSKGDKIVIDIDKGTQKTVSEFLSSRLGDRAFSQKCTLLEQNDVISFLVHPGAKITLASLYENLLNSHPDALRDTQHLATVTCLGEDRRGQLYILTAKHIFGNGSSQSDDRGFISNYHSKLTEVSDSLRGILDVAIVENGNRQWIDIAALPLTPSIQQGLLDGCPELMYDLKRIYTGCGTSYRGLRDRVVFKHGAISGNTCGRITYPKRSIRLPNNTGRNLSGCVFFIEPNDRRDPTYMFAKPGDSGSLIWDENGVPIGLVFASTENLRRDDDAGTIIQYATFGVRLDYCLRVLKDKTGIDIIKCRAVGSPIPVVNEPGVGQFGSGEVEGAEAMETA